MKFSDELEFEHRDWREVYNYVERHGTVDYHRARKALDMSEQMFGTYVTILKREGILRRDGDELRVAFESEEAERIMDDGVEYVVRQAQEDDLDGLLAAIRRALGDDRDYVLGESIAAIIEDERVLLRRNEVESRVFFVATVGDEVVGWVHLDAPEIESLDHTAQLTVGVLEEYRGHGIGSHLLQRGLQWAAENGFDSLAGFGLRDVGAFRDALDEFGIVHGLLRRNVRVRGPDPEADVPTPLP